MELQVLKVESAPWFSFSSEVMQGPMGFVKSINISTDFGLRKQDIYFGSTRASGGESQPLLMVELNYRLFSEANNGWAALEISAGEEAIAAVPVEVKQSEVGAVLFTNVAEHVEEAGLCFALDQDLDLVIHGPSGPIAHFPIPADGVTFRQILASLQPAP